MLDIDRHVQSTLQGVAFERGEDFKRTPEVLLPPRAEGSLNEDHCLEVVLKQSTILLGGLPLGAPATPPPPKHAVSVPSVAAHIAPRAMLVLYVLCVAATTGRFGGGGGCARRTAAIKTFITIVLSTTIVVE